MVLSRGCRLIPAQLTSPPKLQRNICCSFLSTSSYCFFSHLGVCRFKYAFPDALSSVPMDSTVSCSGSVADTTRIGCHLLPQDTSAAPPLPKPCHLHPIQIWTWISKHWASVFYLQNKDELPTNHQTKIQRFECKTEGQEKNYNERKTNPGQWRNDFAVVYAVKFLLHYPTTQISYFSSTFFWIL